MAKAVKKPRKKATTGYKMPEPLPLGEILTDLAKHQWKLGPFVGKGGFGEIYSAQEVSAKASKKFPYVVKVEPHENGPLFVERNFYMKNAQPINIDAFKKKHKLKTFGMPAYLGSGSHEHGSNKYRFIVMEKFGTDLDKLKQEQGGAFPVSVVFQLAWQMTYVLEYIHECEYVHADLKGANILMGITPENKNQAYLVDFGLATRFSKENEYKPNPKKANDGTIEYLSRDAHQGVPTRRGDLEILGYNIIHWLGGKLPWENCLNDVKAVQQGKEEAMNDVGSFVKNCFGSAKTKGADTLIQFLKYVNTLKFNDNPNYKKIRELFKKEVENNDAKVDGPLDFQTRRKRRSVGDEMETPGKKTKDEKVTRRKKIEKEEETTVKVVKKEKVGRRKKDDKEKKEEITDEVETGNDEEENNVDKMSTDSIETPKKKVTRKVTKKEDKTEENDDLEVMTDAMKEVLAKKMSRNVKTKKTQKGVDENYEGYTAEMMEIKMKKINNDHKNKNQVNGDSGGSVSTRLRNRK